MEPIYIGATRAVVGVVLAFVVRLVADARARLVSVSAERAQPLAYFGLHFRARGNREASKFPPAAHSTSGARHQCSGRVP